MSTRFKKQIEKTNFLHIPFIMAGDPSEEVTIELAFVLQEAGAHILELGIPYSDPLADGPVIQRAASRALKQGMTLKKAMQLIPKFRKRGVKIPVIVFTYYNPVLQLGEESFFALARENDVDGLLIPDLPYEESEAIRTRCLKEGIEYISLVAPTSTDRIQKIASHAHGFLYCVSSLGVTGIRKSLDENIIPFLEKVKQFSNIPVAVGFGISNRQQVHMLEEHCDGIIVGSAIVKKIEELKEQLLHDNQTLHNQALREFTETVQSIFSVS